MRIALFDIDGTILLAHGAGRRAMERALREVAGVDGPAGQHYAGKTDPQIVREALRHAGLSDADVDARMPGVLARYLAGLSDELATDRTEPVEALPGVPEILDRCHGHARIVLGLLTGNLWEGAQHKLRAAGIDPRRFAVGAFGSDHEHRPTLAALARDRAAAHLGTAVAGEACVVIGDTPADIECGLAIGARTVGVATGNFSARELARYGPYAVFEDFRDTTAVMQVILDD